MSVQLYSARERGAEGADGTPQISTVGGNKPLHRFIKGQPKVVGIVVLILGVSFFMSAIAQRDYYMGLRVLLAIPCGYIMGTLFIICGILYILTEHNPTKRNVTASLALTILTILGTLWSLLTLTTELSHSHHDYTDLEDYNVTESDDPYSITDYMAMELTLQLILTFYGFGGIIIFIVMSTLAIASLRSTKSQTVVVMTTSPTETPAQ